MEMVLLGLLQKGSKSTYDLQGELAASRLSRWVKFSIPGLYRSVIQLTAKGYLSKSTPEEEKEDRAVYALTDAGQRYFEQLMLTWARQPVSLYLECNTVVAHLDRLEPEQALAVTAALRESLLSSADSARPAAEEELTFPERALFDQQRLLYQALLQWLDGVEEHLRSL